jgi:hypothetical protein
MTFRRTVISLYRFVLTWSPHKRFAFVAGSHFSGIMP